MSDKKSSSSEQSAPASEDEFSNELLNAEAAKKLKQAEDQVKETAHDIERNLK